MESHSLISMSYRSFSSHILLPPHEASRMGQIVLGSYSNPAKLGFCTWWQMSTQLFSAPVRQCHHRCYTNTTGPSVYSCRGLIQLPSKTVPTQSHPTQLSDKRLFSDACKRCMQSSWLKGHADPKYDYSTVSAKLLFFTTNQ